MNCPRCKHSNTQVTNSRRTKQDSQVWRRRRCKSCMRVFTTYEAVDPRFITVGSEKSAKAYDRAKLFSSVYGALGESAAEDSFHLTETIERKIIDENSEVVSSQRIVELTAETLKGYSKPAYMRYISFYPEVMRGSGF